jgi:hypothetical protein
MPYSKSLEPLGLNASKVVHDVLVFADDPGPASLHIESMLGQGSEVIRLANALNRPNGPWSEKKKKLTLGAPAARRARSVRRATGGLIEYVV